MNLQRILTYFHTYSDGSRWTGWRMVIRCNWMKVFSRVVSPVAVNFLGSAGSVFLMLWWDLLFMLLAFVMWWMLTIHARLARHGFHFLAEFVQVSVEEICSQILIYCIMCLSMPKALVSVPGTPSQTHKNTCTRQRLFHGISASPNPVLVPQASTLKPS